MHVGVIVAVIRVRIEQRFVSIRQSISVRVADPREFRFLSCYDDETFRILGHNTEAVEQAFSEQSPLAIH